MRILDEVLFSNRLSQADGLLSEKNRRKVYEGTFREMKVLFYV